MGVRVGSNISCRDLTVGHRGRPVLASVTMEVGIGVTAIVGRNGAGKSTLLRTLATLIPPIDGSFSICGHAGNRRRELASIRQRLGVVPQQPDFPPSFTVQEMLDYTAALQRVDRPSVAAACTTFELEAVRTSRIGELSGGQRRRAFLAQATLHEPSVLLLDEPTVGLDIPSRHEFKRFLRAVGSERTVVLTTHLVDDLVGLADAVVVIDSRGRTRHLGGVESIAEDGRMRGLDLEATILDELGRP